MMFQRILSLLVLCLLGPVPLARAADRFVAPHGDDRNNGTTDSPWRTVSHAAANVQAGDTVWVRSGIYDERVVTRRGGTSEAHRVRFLGQGNVTLRGFEVTQPYITVQGFEFTGHASTDVLDGYVVATSSADHLDFINNTVRDGIFSVRHDFVFNDRTITSPTASFLSERFRPGQNILIARATNNVTPANLGPRTIEAVTEGALTISNTLTNEGPIPAYLTASYCYGLVLRSGSQNCRILNNSFHNLSYDAWFIAGTNHVLEGNELTRLHGWDAMHFMGSDHVFRSNFIHSSPLVVYQVSPDVFENYPLSLYRRILFERNFVRGFPGVLSSQKGVPGAMSHLTFRNNVFIDVGRFVMINPHSTFENNTFLAVAARSTPVNSTAAHAMRFLESDVDHVILRNNVFVGCGEGRNPDLIGWYEFGRLPQNHEIHHNFVAGPAPGFAAKGGFTNEVPLLNGGDPGFVNIDAPLGADGLPFTDDDGLRLRPDSRLREAGFGGVDLGAYNTAEPRPTLSIAGPDNGTLTLFWLATDDTYRLQAAMDLLGPWADADVTPTRLGETNVVTLALDNVQFFRLTR